MKKILLISILLLVSARFYSETTEPEVLGSGCNQYIKSPFIKNSHPMKAFLSGDEVAEFHATFFKGTIYRIVACSGDNSSVPFTILDKTGKVLFSNEKYSLKSYWDFKMEGDLDCVIEAKLNSSKQASGVVSIQIGFKNISEEAKPEITENTSN